ncbi:MAG TPA: hypothetical protein VNM22_17995 [Candidatus Limnocylindrales bacterium]|nr:hypothetical protein [Candidatus Limnocylindrales bacterium]
MQLPINIFPFRELKGYGILLAFLMEILTPAKAQDTVMGLGDPNFKAQMDYGLFNVWVIYPKEQALQGKENTPFNIRIQAMLKPEGDVTRLKILDLSPLDSGVGIRFRFVRDQLCGEVSGSIVCKEFVYSLAIDPKVIPRRHPIQFKIQYKDFEVIPIEELLYVGTTNRGLLEVSGSWNRNQKWDVGDRKILTIPLENNFPDYILFLDEVIVELNRQDLYEVTETHPEQIFPGEKNAEIILKARVLTFPWNTLFSRNFSPDDTARVKINYRDEYGRSIRDFSFTVPVTFQIRDLTLYLYLLFPLLLGTCIGSYLKLTKTKEPWKPFHLLSSCLVGLVAYTLAFSGRFEISAFNFSFQAKDALGTLLIGFLSGWWGLELIDKLFGGTAETDKKT